MENATTWLKIERNETKTKVEANGTMEDLILTLIGVMRDNEELKAVIATAAITCLLADGTQDGTLDKLKDIKTKYMA